MLDLLAYNLFYRCVYFLDPDYIVPPFVSAPPVPLVPRARTNSLSTHESEHVILEPPVSNNPMLCRPILPAADIAAIRRLSARVNVLPVLARADTLTTDRLTAVKMAIRRDLAEAGIGFGIFDLDIPLYAQLESKVAKNKSENGFMKHHMNGNTHSPPSTPITPTLLRLPFSLISPDIYSHSDGVNRNQPSRHELVHQYAPSKHGAVKHQSTPKTALGRFVRNYRWGSLDVMDASHCEFLHLRGAVFHHMEVLDRCTNLSGRGILTHRYHSLRHYKNTLESICSRSLGRRCSLRRHLPSVRLSSPRGKRTACRLCIAHALSSLSTPHQHMRMGMVMSLCRVQGSSMATDPLKSSPRRLWRSCHRRRACLPVSPVDMAPPLRVR